MLGCELLAKTYESTASETSKRWIFLIFRPIFVQKKEKNVGPFLHDGIFDDDKDASTTPSFA